MVQVVNEQYWQQEEEAAAYIGRIRNLRKREYAKSYWLYLRYGGVQPSRGELSYMAAQAVRITLDRYAS